MRIKKFTCINCGAPKVNPYTEPYIMCDYCGSFTDIDYTLGLNFWTAVPEKTARYQKEKIDYTAKLAAAFKKGDKERYKNLQYSYWDDYYKFYPEYIPPTIDNDDKYKKYLEVCADSTTNYTFDPSWKGRENEMAIIQQKISYYATPQGETKVTTESFFPMAEYYIYYIKDSFKDFYENPDYAIMYELLPPAVHLKMKISMFVQIWLPYLSEEDGDKFLSMTGFKIQYVDVEKPEGKSMSCAHCSNELFAPAGSFRIYCEKCHKTTSVQSSFKCMSCGAENTVPENPAKPIDCAFCGVENRLIQPLFG